MKGYKKCLDETKTKFVLVELEIPADAKYIVPEDDLWFFNLGKKMRASKAKVVKIHGGGKVAYSLRRRWFEYKVGEFIVPEEEFDYNLNQTCGSGIHFFETKEEACKFFSGDEMWSYETLEMEEKYPPDVWGYPHESQEIRNAIIIRVTDAIVDKEEEQ